MVGHTYNYWLVLASVIISIVASYTALTFSQRMTVAQERGVDYMPWLFASAGIMGFGIWSMHFVAMLSYVVDVEVRYRVGLTVISAAFAIIGTAIGFWLVRDHRQFLTLVPAGIFMGLAIVSMHYTGMFAYDATMVQQVYNPSIVALSVAIAVSASIVALWVVFSAPENRLVKAAAAVILGAAVSGMHYTGMAALTMQHGGPPLEPVGFWSISVDPNYLAIATIAVTLAIFVVSFLAVAQDERRGNG